jgi:hypothetical protein
MFTYGTRYSCQILMKHEFSRKVFEKKFQILKFMKIRPVEAELLHADGQTDRFDEGITRFSKFLKASKTLGV